MSPTFSSLDDFKRQVGTGKAFVFCVGMGNSKPYTNILSHFRMFSQIYDGVDFHGFDFNDQVGGNIATELHIMHMPIVIVYKDGKNKGQAVSPNVSRIEELIKKVA